MAHLLIIDDSESVTAFARSALEKAGHRVVTTRDGREGIKQLGSQQFDLAITDIYMPDRDGIEVIMQARRHRISTPIIAMSSNDGLVDALQIALKIGASAQLAKPFTESQLLEVVNRFIGSDNHSVSSLRS